MDQSPGAPSPAFPHAVANHPPPLAQQDPTQDPLLQNMIVNAATLAEPPSPGAHPQQQMILHHHSQFTTAGIVAAPAPAPAPLLDSPKKLLPLHRPVSSDNSPASPPPPPPPHHSPPHWSPQQPLQTQRRHRDLDRLEDAQWQVSPCGLQSRPTSSSMSLRDESSSPHPYSPFEALPNQPPSTFISRPSNPMARPVVFDRGSYDQHNPFPTRQTDSAQHPDNSAELQQRTLVWSKDLGNHSTLQYQPGYHSRTTRSQDEQSPNPWQESDHDTQEQQPRQGHVGDHAHNNGSNVSGVNDSGRSIGSAGRSQSHQRQHSRQHGSHRSAQSQPLPSPQPQSHHQSPYHHQPQYPGDGNHSHRPSSYSPRSSASASTPDSQYQYQNYPAPQQQRQQQRLKTPPVPMTGSEAHNHHRYDNNDRRSLDHGLEQTEASSSSDVEIGRRYDHRPDCSPGYPPDHRPMHRPLSPPLRGQNQQHGPPPSQIGLPSRPQSLPRPPLPVYQEGHQETPSQLSDIIKRDNFSRQAPPSHSSRADWAVDDRRDRRDRHSELSSDPPGHYHDEQQIHQSRDRDAGPLRSQQGHARPDTAPYSQSNRQLTPPSLAPSSNGQSSSLKSHWHREESRDHAEGVHNLNKPWIDTNTGSSSSDGESNWRTKTRTKEDLQFRFGTDMPKTVDLKSAIETCDTLCQFALHFASQDPSEMRHSMQEDDETPVDPNDRATLQMIRNLAGTMLVGIQQAGGSDINTPSPGDDLQPTENEIAAFETNGDYTQLNGSAGATDREREEAPRFGAGPPSNEMVHELAKAATSIFQLAIRIKAWVNMTSGERELDEEINIIRGKRCLFLDEMTPLSMQPTQDLNGGVSGYSQQQPSSTPYHTNANSGPIPGFGSTSSFQSPGTKRPLEDSLSHPAFIRFGGAISKRGGGNKMAKLLKTGIENDSDTLHQKYRKRAKRTHPLGRCLSCDTTDTPEWRRGPDGARTLCNACGLHYAKLVKRQKQQQQQIQGQDLEQQDPTATVTEMSTLNEIPTTTYTESPNGVGALVAGQPMRSAEPNVLDYTVGSGPSRPSAQSPSEHPIDSSDMDDDTVMS